MFGFTCVGDLIIDYLLYAMFCGGLVTSANRRRQRAHVWERDTSACLGPRVGLTWAVCSIQLDNIRVKNVSGGNDNFDVVNIKVLIAVAAP